MFIYLPGSSGGFRSSGKSWWRKSWFKGGGGSGGNYDGEHDEIAVEKVIFVMAVIAVTLVCIYYSLKYKHKAKKILNKRLRKSDKKLPQFSSTQKNDLILPFAMNSSSNSRSYSQPQSTHQFSAIVRISEPVIHPNDPNKILPFASSPPPVYS